MSNYVYDDYIKTLNERFQSELTEIEAEYGFEYGTEFEQAICNWLRRALPTKYGIARGYAVDQDGNKAGDDIIIYDQYRFPSLWLRQKDDYSRKENISIEAIYCYIEAKHTINILGDDESSLLQAVRQVNSVKRLCNRREKIPSSARDKRLGYPSYANPVFGVIFARQARKQRGDKNLATPMEISTYLQNELKRPILSSGIVEHVPDLEIIGGHNVLIPAIAKGADKAELVPFYLLEKSSVSGGKKGSRPALLHLYTGNAFGIAFASIMAAIDWINLSKMPWFDLVVDAVNKDFGDHAQTER